MCRLRTGGSSIEPRLRHGRSSRQLCLAAALAFSLGVVAHAAPGPEQLERWLRRYPEADADGDGKLSPREAVEYRRKLRGAKGRAHGGPGRPERPRPTYADVRYGEQARNVLDFWRADSDRPAPVAVYIHGGGFVGGSKDKVAPLMIEELNAAGISVAAISYRYATTAPLPVPLFDCARAVQFIRSRSREWNVDVTRIGCWGGSAGGCASMWLAFHDDLADPGSDDPVVRQSSRITCAAPSGGQSSVDWKWIDREFAGGQAKRYAGLYRVFGAGTDEELETPEVRRRIGESSPVNHLTPDDKTPLYMTYGVPDVPVTADTDPGTIIHHPRFGLRLKEDMDRLGIESVLVIKGEPRRGDAYGSVLGFLKAKLSAERPGGAGAEPEEPAASASRARAEAAEMPVPGEAARAGGITQEAEKADDPGSRVALLSTGAALLVLCAAGGVAWRLRRREPPRAVAAEPKESVR